MTIPLLIEGDLGCGQLPGLTAPHWRGSTVDPATGARSGPTAMTYSTALSKP